MAHLPQRHAALSFGFSLFRPGVQLLLTLMGLLVNAGASASEVVDRITGMSVSQAGGAAQSENHVRLSLIETSGSTTRESLVVKGGSWTKTLTLGNVAVLVEHPQGRFLYDTGLGRKIDEQFQEDMPWYYKSLFAYNTVTPARDQLDAAGLEIERIILSHAHWDHASGLVDFPEAEVWVTPQEKALIEKGGPPGIFASQVRSGDVRWHLLEWSDQPYRSYDRSLDLYGDGTVVLVPQEGHTPGGVGMFVRVASGREFFLIGDTVWNLRGIAERLPKFWVARRVVDTDAKATMREVERVADLAERFPAMTVVPAHDRRVHKSMGYFPQWVE